MTTPTTRYGTDYDVLVVGAGPAGLSTALAAARHGARVLVVERHPGTSIHPRALGISTRTMEIFRAWGIAGAVRELAIPCEPTVAVARTLLDPPRETGSVAGYPTAREALAVSPESPAVCPQDHVEPLLVEQVRRHGGEVRFRTHLTGLRVTPDGVRAELGAHRVHARFVVGADGNRGTVRSALGIARRHLGTLAESVQVLFHPDPAPPLEHLPHPLTFVDEPQPGLLMPMGAGRWAYAQSWPERGEGPTADPEYWTSVLRAATGMPELRPEIIDVMQFTMAAEVAATFRAGPGFLVGDAAHRMTPIGGIGMNTAIHDGYELGWKLAWVARGLAGEALLDSHEAERGPVGRANAARTLRDERHPADGLPGDLGRTYRSAVVAADRTRGAAPEFRVDLAARPGERAPHVWVGPAPRRSTLDLLDGRLTLVTGTAGDGWDRAAGRLPGAPVDVLVTGRSVPDPGGALARAYRLGLDSAVLVRPDGRVAWRHDGICADHTTALAGAVSTALGRGSARAALAC